MQALSLARRLALGAVAAAALGAAAQAQIVQPACTGFFNNNFSSGSAFWPVDIHTGGWGDSFGGVFTSFAPLSLVPPAQGNIATFFTEAFAAGDCEAPLGSAHNSQAILSRTLTSVPSNRRLRFKYGAQLSFVLVNQSSVEFQLSVIVRNLTTGQEVKCKLPGGKKVIADGEAGEDIFFVPFTTYNPCNCNTAGLYNVGDIVEILAIGTVQANAKSMGQSAFIGGPIFWDDFEFCNVLCPIISDPPKEIDLPAEPLQLAIPGGTPGNFDTLAKVNARERALKMIDADNDGSISKQEWEDFGLARGGVPILIDANPDLNADGIVDQKDVDLMIGMINGVDSPRIEADLNGDGRVDGNDLEQLLDSIR